MRIIKSLETGVAGNTVSTITVGQDEYRILLYGQITLTTDATVANRRVIFQILDASSNVIFDSRAGAVVAASQSDQAHEFMPGIFRETTFVGGALQVPIPINCIIPPGYSYRMTIDNGQAGDSYDFGGIAQTIPVADGSVIVEA